MSLSGGSFWGYLGWLCRKGVERFRELGESLFEEKDNTGTVWRACLFDRTSIHKHNDE
jgi:hypothetical protein